MLTVRYVGLAKSLSGVEEEVISESVGSLKDVLEILSARHGGAIGDALVSNGYTHVGQLMIEMNGRSLRLEDANEIKIDGSVAALSIFVIPTVVGG